MNIVEQFKAKAAQLKGSVVLPESLDVRVLTAAAAITGQGLARVVLVGQDAAIHAAAAEHGVKLDGVDILDPQSYPEIDTFAGFLYEKRKAKGLTLEQAAQTVRQPLYFGALLVKFGKVSGMVAGAANTTGDVLRAALQVVGVAKGLKTVSSSFIMVNPQSVDGKDVFLFGDCAVVPNPTAEQLADIAMSTATTRRKLLGDEPNVALLSFSTKGSAKHELVDKVTEARDILAGRDVDFAFDGELQLDAAVIEKVGGSKAPESSVAGKANVLVFPDLQAGNIGYKLVQRFAGAEAIGPVIQGLGAPICDLSRGCSAEDIINTTALVLLMAQ
jgi:phosphate acetyltransferase